MEIRTQDTDQDPWFNSAHLLEASGVSRQVKVGFYSGMNVVSL